MPGTTRTVVTLRGDSSATCSHAQKARHGTRVCPSAARSTEPSALSSAPSVGFLLIINPIVWPVNHRPKDCAQSRLGADFLSREGSSASIMRWVFSLFQHLASHNSLQPAVSFRPIYQPVPKVGNTHGVPNVLCFSVGSTAGKVGCSLFAALGLLPTAVFCLWWQSLRHFWFGSLVPGSKSGGSGMPCLCSSMELTPNTQSGLRPKDFLSSSLHYILQLQLFYFFFSFSF